MSSFSTLVQYSVGTSSQCIKARKGNKRHKGQKGRNKHLFADDIIVYIEDPKISTKNY